MRDGGHDTPNVRRVRRREDSADPPVPEVEVAALRYEAGEDNAPVLLARGKGHAVVHQYHHAH